MLDTYEETLNKVSIEIQSKLKIYTLKPFYCFV